MTRLDPKSAAVVIRPLSAQYPPEDHAAAAVCKHLGIEPTAINLSHVSWLLGVANVENFVPELFPRMHLENGKPVVYPEGHHRQGEMVVFASPEEESSYMAGTAA